MSFTWPSRNRSRRSDPAAGPAHLLFARAAGCRVPDLLLPGNRARPAAGLLGALPDLEPGSQRDPAAAVRVEHSPERPVLHHLPGCHPPGDGAGAAGLLLERLGAYRPRHV